MSAAIVKAIPVITLLFVPCICEVVESVERQGRRIQLDGFLMEWSDENTKSWGGDTMWYRDAIVTSEGLAGYFSADSALTCSLSTFILTQPDSEKRWEMTIPKGSGNGFYQVANENDGVTIEWVLSWDSVVTDTAGAYTFLLSGYNACGDTLPRVRLIGKTGHEESSSFLSTGLIVRIILIALLLGAFLYVQLKMRRRTPKKGFPHR